MKNNPGILSRGNGSRTIVLLHAWGMSKETFSPLINRLSRQFRVVAMDLPGHGDLADMNPPDSTIRGYDWLSEWLIVKVRSLHLSSAMFVGWSLGAHTLLHAAPQLERNGARGLTVMGGCPHGAPTTANSVRNVEVDEQELIKVCFRPKRQRFPTTFRSAFRKSNAKVRRLVRNTVDQGAHENERRIIDNLAIPLAIIRGVDDKCNLPDDFEGLTDKCWDGRIVQLAQAGHAVHWERSAAVAKYISHFADFCFAPR